MRAGERRDGHLLGRRWPLHTADATWLKKTLAAQPGTYVVNIQDAQGLSWFLFSSKAPQSIEKVDYYIVKQADDLLHIGGLIGDAAKAAEYLVRFFP
jgi:hypothetical protein